VSEDDKTETRSITFEQAKAGVKLIAGHRVVLVISSLKGTPSAADSAGEDAPSRSEDASSQAEEPASPAEEADAAEVWLEFDEQVVSALPGASIAFSGEGVPKQELPLAASVRLAWNGASRKITVEARAGGRSAVLLDRQPAGDPGAALHWSGHLEDLLEHGPPEEGRSTGGSMGDSHLHLTVEF